MSVIIVGVLGSLVGMSVGGIIAYFGTRWIMKRPIN